MLLSNIKHKEASTSAKIFLGWTVHMMKLLHNSNLAALVIFFHVFLERVAEEDSYAAWIFIKCLTNLELRTVFLPLAILSIR